jgi:hypothetical protein
MRATQSSHLVLNCWMTLEIEVFDMERPNRRYDALYGAKLSGVCWDGYLVAQYICR